MAIRLPVVIALAALLACGVLHSLPVRAAVLPDSTKRSGLVGPMATLLRGGEMGELLSVCVPRGEADVQRQLDDARKVERSAAEQIDGTRALGEDADGRVRILREEIQTTRVRLDVARRAGDLAAIRELENMYKRQNHEFEYFQQVRDALKADVDRLEAERSAASARTRAFELELNVARKNAELMVTQIPGAVAQYRALLRDMLDAQRSAAERGRDAAEFGRLVAERRLRQLDSLARLSAATKR